MFFVKTNVNDATEINTEITDDNVYSYCPECGAEVPVLCFSEMIKDEDVDLYNALAMYREVCRCRGEKAAKCVINPLIQL